MLTMSQIKTSGIDSLKLEKSSSKMFKTVLVECALQHLKKKQFTKCVDFLGRVTKEYQFA
jgi:hypothetical protein